MCGIAGIWGDASVERLAAMADALRHRGPDDDGTWRSDDDRLGLTYRRLAVIDLEGGRQPIANEDGRVVAVCNGEIYNYRELRQELFSRGHRLTTHGDTEVIVHLYEDYGDSFVDKLRGMFAIAVWDDRERRLVLVRDRVGKKPLYFSESHGEFLFASEIKGLLAALPAVPALDEQAIADYLHWHVVPAPGTIYQGIRSLRPGERMVVQDARVVHVERYWQQRMLPKTHMSRREAVERVDDMLHESIRLRMRSDVPVGCFLSGGIDSGIITAIASGMAPEKLITITVGFEDGAFDERPLARLVAEQYGTDHHELVVRPDLSADLPKIIAAYDQPFGDSSAIPTYYVARATRELVTVVLTGDGADELFAGYRRYVAARISGHLPAGPWRALHRAMPSPRGYRSPYAFMHRLVRGMSLPPTERYIAWSVDAFGADDISAMWRADTRDAKASLGERCDRFARVSLDDLRDCELVDQMLGTDFATILPNDLLVKMDIATMAHGLEARSPFLDHKLVEAVSLLPDDVKLGGLTTKPLLRALSARYVPKPIRTAPKRGFEVPLVRWLRHDLKDLCEDVVLSRGGLLADLFDRRALERIVREQDGLDPARWARRLWLLLTLGLWDACVSADRTRGR